MDGNDKRCEAMVSTAKDVSDRPRRVKPPRRALDAQSRELLKRFIADWIRPRWRQLAVALVLTAALALATGAYPLVIKLSFDKLLAGDISWLPLVLAEIIFITLARAVLLYFQTIKTQRIGLRLAADMQATTFRHLINADYARLTRDTPGRMMSKLTHDIGFVRQTTLAKK